MRSQSATISWSWPGRPCFLQPVDFPLQLGPFPVVAEPFERPDAVGGVRGSALSGGRFPGPARLLLYLDARSGHRVMTPRANPAGIAPAGGSPGSPAPPDRRLPARAGPPGPRLGWCIRAQIRPRSATLTCPIAGTRRCTSSTLVCRWTAAFRISARTTSSVIRALCDSLSANWSRWAASGIRAATASIFPRNDRRPSSVDRSSSAADRSSRYSRYCRELRSSSWYAGGAMPTGCSYRDHRRPAAWRRSPETPRRPAVPTTSQPRPVRRRPDRSSGRLCRRIAAAAAPAPASAPFPTRRRRW